jgi:hypothetical protein
MANAYYKASKQPALQANERLNRLKRAYAYVGDSVHNFPCGFTQSIGSWTLADDIRDELRTLRVLVEPIAAPSPRPAFCP